MRNFKTAIITIASVSLIGMSASAFAHGGMGPGRYGKGYGPGNCSQLSQEEYEQVQKQRNAFFKETEGLRNEIFEKERALQNELAKETPDAAKASELQKELSGLQAQFDQKRINQMVEMRKLTPNAGSGYWMGGPRMGRGHGHMMGNGAMMGYGYNQGNYDNQ